jgi:hypothetical protein
MVCSTGGGGGGVALDPLEFPTEPQPDRQAKDRKRKNVFMAYPFDKMNYFFSTTGVRFDILKDRSMTFSNDCDLAL